MSAINRSAVSQQDLLKLDDPEGKQKQDSYC
jgi:hypothetical protein